MKLFAITPLRRSVILVTGLALTVFFSWRAYNAGGVYWGEADVVFLAPKNAVDANSLTFTTSDAVATAGLVAIEVFRATRPRVSAPDVSLYSMGHDSDLQVTQPNSGGQWVVNFSEALINVQVVSPTASRARAELDHELNAIGRMLRELQFESEAAPGPRIKATVSPGTPSIRYVRGSSTRALASTFMLGCLLTLAVMNLGDRLARRRRQAVVDVPTSSTQPDHD